MGPLVWVTGKFGSVWRSPVSFGVFGTSRSFRLAGSPPTPPKPGVSHTDTLGRAPRAHRVFTWVPIAQQLRSGVFDRWLELTDVAAFKGYYGSAAGSTYMLCRRDRDRNM